MPDRPNILLLMADQLRQDALACYGNPIIRTPNIDRLASRGVRFSEALCPTPICVASRMSLITGHRAARHRFTANTPAPGPIPELPTIMTLLHRAGYYNQGVGKMHFRGRMYGFQSLLRMEETARYRADDDYLLHLRACGIRTRYPQGLRDLLYYQPQTSRLPEAHSQSRWVADRSVEFLRDHVRHRSGQPFFLWSSWIAPHPPFAPCEPYDRLYHPDTLPLPVFPERPLASIPRPARGHRGRLEGAHLDPGRIRRIRALYAGQVTHVDACVGSVLDELERLGLGQDTIVLFASDHGDMLGDHGLSQKNVPYGPSVRIPMVVRWPERTEAGTTCDALVGLEDVLPTLVQELGLEYDQGAGELPGRSLLTTLAGGDPREHYIIDYGHGEGRWVSVRSRTHTYALWASGGYEELYDLTRDPHETTNLAAEQPGLASSLRELALDWERRWGLRESPDRGAFRTWPATPTLQTDRSATVVINEATWPENLPREERDSVETYAEAFTRAISREDTLSPGKLSLGLYKRRGGNPLIGTPWQQEWEQA